MSVKSQILLVPASCLRYDKSNDTYVVGGAEIAIAREISQKVLKCVSEIEELIELIKVEEEHG